MAKAAVEFAEIFSLVFGVAYFGFNVADISINVPLLALVSSVVAIPSV
jgi:hypothetical protein